MDGATLDLVLETEYASPTTAKLNWTLPARCNVLGHIDEYFIQKNKNMKELFEVTGKFGTKIGVIEHFFVEFSKAFELKFQSFPGK